MMTPEQAVEILRALHDKTLLDDARSQLPAALHLAIDALVAHDLLREASAEATGIINDGSAEIVRLREERAELSQENLAHVTRLQELESASGALKLVHVSIRLSLANPEAKGFDVVETLERIHASGVSLQRADRIEAGLRNLHGLLADKP